MCGWCRCGRCRMPRRSASARSASTGKAPEDAAMDRAPRRPETWLVALAAASAAAWAALALDADALTLPALCAAGAAWAGSLADTLRLALAFNSPARLATEWALMVAAM